jgi:serine/threonine protein kinase
MVDVERMTEPSLLGTLLDGKFQIEKALASGASGDVYEALHLGLGARVAVKVLRPGIPETADIRRKRFMREARVAARIQSDHVVRVFDIVAPEHGETYIVMELLEGETLAARAHRVGRLPIADAVDYVLQAAKPLAEMHDAGVVHRDVKPSNLFLSRDKDGKERVKLIDFGVAAFRQPLARGESSLTLAETVIGTPRYMAPEQVQGLKVDARADVWALGVTLYVLLAGRAPFDAETPLAVMNQIEHTEAPALSGHCAEVPAALAEVVHRCLAKDPAERPADARALVFALTPFMRGASAAPVTASKAHPPRTWRSAALVALVVITGGIVVMVARREAIEARTMATTSNASAVPVVAAEPLSTPSIAASVTRATASPSPVAPALVATMTASASAAAPHRPPLRRPIKSATRQDDDRIE